MSKELNKTKKSEGFFSGVAVLTVSTLIVKAIGALFKIPMIKYIGIDGMGYFNAAYHFYSLLMTISTAGLPVALSILISRDLAQNNLRSVKKDYGCAIVLFCSFGALFSLLMLVLSERIACMLGIPDTKYCLAAVSPAVFFVTVSGAVRGYFQGHGIMTPTAVSQVTESVGKLFCGLGLALYALKKGKPPHIVAAYAIFGLTLGLLLSALYLLLAKKRHDKKNKSAVSFEAYAGVRETLATLIKTALPVTLSSSVLSLTALLDTLVIPNALMRSGIDSHTALNLYSTYTNLALPLFAFPTAFITPVSLVLVPASSAATGIGDKSRRDEVLASSFRLCACMMLPCAFGMGVLARPILEFVFSGESAAISVGADLLSVLSVSVFLSGLITVSNAMLQSCGRQMKPIISLALGAAVKLLCELAFVSLPTVNIYGAPISTFFCSFTVVAVNLYFLAKETDGSFSPTRLFLRPVISSALAGGFALFCYRFLPDACPDAVRLLTSVALTALFYIIISLRTGAVLREDVLIMPKGEKIYSLLKVIKLIK